MAEPPAIWQAIVWALALCRAQSVGARPEHYRVGEGRRRDIARVMRLISEMIVPQAVRKRGSPWSAATSPEGAPSPLWPVECVALAKQDAHAVLACRPFVFFVGSEPRRNPSVPDAFGGVRKASSPAKRKRRARPDSVGTRRRTPSASPISRQHSEERVSHIPGQRCPWPKSCRSFPAMATGKSQAPA